MQVEVRLFAVLRERAGRETLSLELADGATVADALAAAAREPGLGEVLAAMPVRAALNREYVDDDALVSAGDELVLIPPVSGGATAAARARVTDQPLSVAELAAAVGRPGAGATVVFCGTTRDVDRLEYEAYVEMAEERIATIVAEAVERHDLCAAAAEHRVGDVPLTEPSVIVAASSAHRGEAFAAAREIIDRVKAEAPIWKKEIEGGEGRWVEGTKP
jgi:molybdopterin synthase catalytic subunit